MDRTSGSRRRGASAALAIAALIPAVVIGACKNSPSEPVTADPATTSGRGGANGLSPVLKQRMSSPSARLTPRKPAVVVGRPAASVAPAADDPLHGVFTLDDATKGIDGKGALLATIDTDQGPITCQLYEDKTPITVANFVGLARGLRPWKDPDKKWVKKPAYDGTIFHRIIKGFMIQGGDAAGTGAGEPGYVIPDEVFDGAYHDRAGLLCMANRGPNTNGAQFFITDAAAAHLDNRYTIFGECAPVDTVHKIAQVDVKGEKPVNPPKIKKVTFKRGVSPIPVSSAAPSASAAASDAPPSTMPGTPPEAPR